MECKYCSNNCIKYGFQNNSRQRYKCKSCGKIQLNKYSNNAYNRNTNQDIVALLKEGCGIRSIARLLKISPATVIRRIKEIALIIKKPIIAYKKEYEVDEMCTYISNKKDKYWVAYALQKDTKTVVDFRIGKRTNKTLRPLTQTLILSQTTKIFTDKLMNYRSLIPKEIHSVKQYSINHIERMNLTLRTHLKRLNRRTICYSKSLLMLIACIKIYFWS